jgi:hypothetical protein
VAIRQRFQWSEERGRYRDLRTGRYVSALEVRRAVDQTLRSIGQETRRMADDFRAGRISLDRFRLEMRARTREVHILSAAAARGGMNKMDARAWGQVGGVIAEQDRFIERFIGDIQSGRQPLNGQLNNRAAMYVEAGRTTHERAKREVQADQGMTEERNILRDAKHCGECPELTQRGWVPIGTLPLPGQRECSVNCRCEIETREGAGVALEEPPAPPTIIRGGLVASGDTPDLPPADLDANVQVVTESVANLSKKFKVAPEDVEIVTHEGRKFKVGDREFTEGGHYSPSTQKVQINARYIQTKKQADQIIAHEMTHHAWHEVQRAQQSERSGVEAIFRGERFKEFYYPGSGYLREEKAEEFGKMFPATRLMGKYGMDSYGTTRDEATKNVLDKLKKDDGVTDYSEAYWAAAERNLDIRVNETLAEISALKQDDLVINDKGFKIGQTRKVSPLWNRFHRELLALAGLL